MTWNASHLKVARPVWNPKWSCCPNWRHGRQRAGVVCGSDHPRCDGRPRLEGMLLIVVSGHRRTAGAGVMVKILDAGVETQEFLRSFPSLESLLLS